MIIEAFLIGSILANSLGIVVVRHYQGKHAKQEEKAIKELLMEERRRWKAVLDGD